MGYKNEVTYAANLQHCMLSVGMQKSDHTRKLVWLAVCIVVIDGIDHRRWIRRDSLGVPVIEDFEREERAPREVLEKLRIVFRGINKGFGMVFDLGKVAIEPAAKYKVEREDIDDSPSMEKARHDRSRGFRTER